MYWIDLPGSELMSRVFSQSPKIEKINLFNIEIKRDGPTVILAFDIIDTLPDKAPIKWGKEFNRCRIGIYCFGVSNISLSGISTEMLASISIDLNGEDKKIKIESDSFSMNVECSHISLIGPSVYFSK